MLLFSAELNAHWRKIVSTSNRLVGVPAQADVAVGAKEKAVGETVEEISQTPGGPRV
jgi:hypothetical protein